jgi:hypothetical protein
MEENGFSAAEVSGSQSGTWSAGTYYMVGDVTVPAGQSLTIQPGANIKVNGNFTFIVEGTLIAEGSVGTFVTFVSNQTVPAAGDWMGIQFKAGSGGSIVNCNISHAHIGLNVSSSTPNLALIELYKCHNHVMVETSAVIINSSSVDESKVKITSGSLDVRYSVNVHASNTTATVPLDLKEITVEVLNAQSSLIDIKLTDITGWARFMNCSAYVKTQAGTDYTMNNHTVNVNDSYHLTARSYPLISLNITSLNISSYQKVTNSGYINQIDLFITFMYPPVIDNWPGKLSGDAITVTEDSSFGVANNFKYYDNDHPTPTLTVSVTSGTYGDLIAKGWAIHTLASEQLTFYCTDETWGNDIINISVMDGTGLKDMKTITMTYVAVNDAPVINLSAVYSSISINQDEVKYIPIEIFDEDDAYDTLDINISSYKYVTLMPNGTLEFLYPNEFGSDGAQDVVYINVSDSVNPITTVSILVTFHQLNDPVEISQTIPDQIKLETDVNWNLDLTDYRYDPDPDEIFSWWVTGLNSNHLTVTGENGSAEVLSFQIVGDDKGGATPKTITDDITMWVKDNGGATDSQALQIKISSVNTAPALSSKTFTPSTGDTNTPFTFRAKYKDLDGSKGDEPAYVKVVIDGTEYDMTKVNATDDDYSEGVVYTYTSTLSAGIHNYYFSCSDSALSGRLPFTAPDNFTTPDITPKIIIQTFWSSDGYVSAKLAFYGEGGTATVSTGITSPDSLPLGLGDIGVYFEITTSNIISIFWGELTVYYTSLDTQWVNNATLSIYNYAEGTSSWVDLGASGNNNQYVTVNRSDAESLILVTPAIVFTAAGDLDADGDGYANDIDKFPFDPAASRDSDDDGHPDSWNKPDSPDITKSTIPTPLDYDEFPNDATEWDDADGDGHGDNIDEFDDNPAAWRDTDGDGMPDELGQREPNPTNLREDTDDDNDGMADWWEEQYGFDPKDPSDADLDDDGDDYSNLEEYQEGTDPTNKDDFPGEDEFISEDLFMYLIIIIIIVVVVVIVAVVMVKRKKPEEEPEVEKPEEAPPTEEAAGPAPTEKAAAPPPAQPPAAAAPPPAPAPAPTPPPTPPTEMPPPPPTPAPEPEPEPESEPW